MSKDKQNELLLKQLKKHKKNLETLAKEFRKGGFVSEETKQLENYVFKIKELEDKLAKRGISTRETASYDDPAFKRAFKKSMEQWALNSKVALNGVSTYFIVDKAEQTMSINDVLSVLEYAVTKDPRAKAAIEAAKVIATVVSVLYRAGLPKQPSLSQIHKKWTEALDQYARKGKYDDEFKAFVKDFQRERKANAGDAVDREDFLTACDDAWKMLPGDTHIQKAFLTKLLKNVPDSWDTDDYAGVAEVNMFGLGSAWKVEKGGQIDDVNEPLMNAIHTVWQRERVINLPIPIRVKVSGVNLGGVVGELERKSDVPGNTSFSVISGGSHLLRDFMNAKAYLLPRVSDLSYDS